MRISLSPEQQNRDLGSHLEVLLGETCLEPSWSYRQRLWVEEVTHARG